MQNYYYDCMQATHAIKLVYIKRPEIIFHAPPHAAGHAQLVLISRQDEEQ